MTRAPLEGPYLEIDMPDYFRLDFMTPSGGWLDEGAFPAAAFEHLQDGGYVLSADGAYVRLRCVEHHGDSFDHVDGGGNIYRYRLVPLHPDGRVIED